ncbi:uncharacterized protein LOC111919887 [Lactuca sativa]|uniref:J domain-containing protein n=1 Tax=Lactuca sativa TaxID=4236 RepID=A0A9R1VU60_LACSA|nr:uncharacterized protein LOC111919887 [Lactuca sativa]KAJ0211963.1 hypothetical protein LSAT_V11C400210390 [Lactuca sativa]
MQILVPRCGRLLFHNFSLIQPRTHSISSSFAACFRSTPTSFEKWKSKWKNSLELGRPKPSKTYIKYKTRQKRADAKKALNDLFFRSGCSKFSLEGEFLKKQGTNKCDETSTDSTENRNKGEPLKYSAFRANKSHHQKRNKSKRKKDFFEGFDDDDDSGMNFHARFGNKSYSWSFKSWEESFSQSQTNGFEWREDSNGANNRNKWRTPSDDDDESDDDYDDEPYIIGSNSDRITLGLPLNGPLKIDEVKNAFRLSALKWHPDKHQGPSQVLAEEKFKLCVNAYKSLCNALSRV